jgi:AcrR family transcriptional regulator
VNAPIVDRPVNIDLRFLSTMPRPADPHAKIDLLRAAEATFAEHGLAAAKVEEITARAGVSKGAFYLHFASKEECFKEIVEGFLARLASCLEPPPTTAAKFSTAPEILAHWHEHDCEVFEFCWQNRRTLGLLFGGRGGPTYAYLIDEFAERAARCIEGWIEHGRSLGVYRADVDARLVSPLVAGAYERLARELIRQTRRPDIPAWCRQTLDLFTRGLLSEGARDIADRKVNVTPTPTRTASARPHVASSRPRPARTRST